MIPGNYNLNIYCGDTERWQFWLWTDYNRTLPADLTGVIVEAAIRDKPIDGTYEDYLACTVTLPNIILMEMTAEQTVEMPTVCNWDMTLFHPSGDIKTILQGSAIMTLNTQFSYSPTRLKRVRWPQSIQLQIPL